MLRERSMTILHVCRRLSDGFRLLYTFSGYIHKSRVQQWQLTQAFLKQQLLQASYVTLQQNAENKSGS